MVEFQTLGSAVVPLLPSFFLGFLSKPRTMNKGTLVIRGLMGSLQKVLERRALACRAVEPKQRARKPDPKPFRISGYWGLEFRVGKFLI